MFFRKSSFSDNPLIALSTNIKKILEQKYPESKILSSVSFDKIRHAWDIKVTFDAASQAQSLVYKKSLENIIQNQEDIRIFYEYGERDDPTLTVVIHAISTNIQINLEELKSNINKVHLTQEDWKIIIEAQKPPSPMPDFKEFAKDIEDSPINSPELEFNNSSSISHRNWQEHISTKADEEKKLISKKEIEDSSIDSPELEFNNSSSISHRNWQERISQKADEEKKLISKKEDEQNKSFCQKISKKCNQCIIM